jgi:NADPH-dependent 2,4-dienoyl-CoA reductase/sulfur reductase-like enzyme
LLRQLAETDLELRPQTLVWGIERSGEGPRPEARPEGWRLALHGPRGLDWLEARAVIVAAGARELVIPFPGWTLPGVMTLGAAQILAKEHGVLPGQRVLLAGSGPLLLAAAAELTRHGAQVAGVLEAAHLSRWLRHAPAIWGNWDRLREAGHYLRALWQARIPYRPGWTVVQALGGDEMEAVVVARLDRRGRPIPGSRQQVPADSLCLGFGFVPNVELTQLAGCAHVFDPARGGWVPCLDQRQETSLPGLYVAGEAAGVAGAGAAMLEGHIAGMAAAHRLGRLPEEQLARELAARAGRRRRLGRFAAMLNTLFAPAPGLDALTTDATPICRCEEVSAGEVRAAIRSGAAELDALKTWTRVGQGACQGRTCGPLLARLVAHETGRPLGQAGCFGVRPPLKPIPLGDLASRLAEYSKGAGLAQEGAP